MAEKKTNEILEEQRRARQEFLDLKKMQQGEMKAPPKPSEVAIVPKTPKEKWDNFWFQYKWYVIAITAITVVVAVMVAQCATRTAYDYEVVLFSYTSVLDEQADKIADYIEKYAEDMNGDGVQEIIVGWRVNAESQAVGVYSIRNFEPKLLMEGLYTQYEILDFDADGRQEMVLLRSDTEGDPVAEYYDWEAQVLQVQSFARLSMTMAELERVDVGTLRGGETALFVTGVAEDTRSVTDILAYRQDVISNIVRSDVTGVTSEIFRYISLEPTDIDGDGVTEVPMPMVLPNSQEGSEEIFWQVDWVSYNARGQRETVVSTYHNINEGWYLLLPDQWSGQIAVRQELDSDERGTIFSARAGDGSYQDVMAIYTITGNSREYKATREGRFVLKREVGTIYSGAFFDYNDSWRHAISQENLNQRFRLIAKEWAIGDN